MEMDLHHLGLFSGAPEPERSSRTIVGSGAAGGEGKFYGITPGGGDEDDDGGLNSAAKQPQKKAQKQLFITQNIPANDSRMTPPQSQSQPLIKASELARMLPRNNATTNNNTGYYTQAQNIHHCDDHNHNHNKAAEEQDHDDDALARLRALSRHIERSNEAAPPLKVLAERNKMTTRAPSLADALVVPIKGRRAYGQSPATFPFSSTPEDLTIFGHSAFTGNDDINSSPSRAARLATIARRKHRKKLARIVADQWMSVAADRLNTLKAKTHHVATQRKRAWRTWRRAVGEAENAAARAGLFVAMAEHQAAARALCAWRNHSAACAHRRFAVMSEAVRSWCIAANDAAQHRILSAKARAHYRLVVMLGGAMLHWRMYMHRVIIEEHRDARAGRHAEMATYRMTLAAWKGLLAYERNTRHRRRVLEHTRRLGLLRVALFQGFRVNVDISRADSTKRLQAARLHATWTRKRAWIAWRVAAASSAGRAALASAALATAVRRVRIGMLLGAWSATRGQTAVQAAKLELARRQRCMTILATALLCWVQQNAQAVRIQIFVATTATRFVSRDALCTWRRRVAREAARAIDERAEWAYDFVFRRRLTLAWREAAHRAACLGDAEDMAFTRRVARTRRAVLTAWQARAKAIFESHEKSERARDHLRAKLLRRFMLKYWLDDGVYGRLRAEAAFAHSRRRQLALGLGSWRSFAESCLQRAEAHRASRRHHYLMTLCACLIRWRSLIRARDARVALLARAAVASRERHLRRALATWRGPFLTWCRHTHALLGDAACFWKAHRLWDALASWRAASALAARARARESEARRHRNLALSGAAFDAMLAHAAMRASQRSAEDSEVLAAVDRLNSSAKRRIFEAWMDAHAVLVIYGFREAQAVAFARHRFGTKVLAAWCQASSESASRGRALDAAIIWWRGRLMTVALREAFEANRAVSIWRRRWTHAALQHARRALILRGLRAWTYYALTYRARKREMLAEASAMHRAELQHVALNMLLVEGMRRKAARMQEAVHATAQRTAARLQLAARFARRWRRTVRDRKSSTSYRVGVVGSSELAFDLPPAVPRSEMSTPVLATTYHLPDQPAPALVAIPSTSRPPPRKPRLVYDEDEDHHTMVVEPAPQAAAAAAPSPPPPPPAPPPPPPPAAAAAATTVLTTPPPAPAPAAPALRRTTMDVVKFSIDDVITEGGDITPETPPPTKEAKASSKVPFDDTPYKAIERAPRSAAMSSSSLKATGALDDAEVQAQLWVMECTMREFQRLQEQVASAKSATAALSAAVSSGGTHAESAWLASCERLQTLVRRRDEVRPVIADMACRIDSMVRCLEKKDSKFLL